MSLIRNAEGEETFIRSLARYIPAPLTLEYLAVRRAQRGCRAATAWLVRQHSGQILGIALRFRLRGLTLWDLYSEGRLGLLDAIGRFEPERGVKFMTYAGWWVRQKIAMAVMNDGGVIRAPVHIHVLLRRMKAAEAELARGRAPDDRPTDDEIAGLLCVDREGSPLGPYHRRNTLEHMCHARASWRAMMPLSLDAPIAENGSPLSELTEGVLEADAVTALDRRELRTVLGKTVSSLTPREQHVIALRVIEERTLEEVAETLANQETGQAITRERVRQIEKRALKKLRLMLRQLYWERMSTP